MKRFKRAVCSTLFGLLLLWAGASSSQPNIVFSVSGDQALIYPASIHYLPDEHTTIIPAGGQPGLPRLLTRTGPPTYGKSTELPGVGGSDTGDRAGRRC